jgi:hypothetical protein
MCESGRSSKTAVAEGDTRWARRGDAGGRGLRCGSRRLAMISRCRGSFLFRFRGHAGRITCQNPKADQDEPPKTFTFDAVFAPSITQRKLYDVCSAPVVASVLEGFNGTIFAYGQTGAGKTFTMEGVQDPPELRGIIPNAFQQIFDRVALAAEGVQFLVRASYLEIYNEEVRDLLAKDPKNRLDLKENVDSGVYVKDLTSFIVKRARGVLTCWGGFPSLS